MAVPTFGGLPIFGATVQISPADTPRAAIESSTFGTDGLGRLDGGGRGLRFTVKGRLGGTGPSGLTLAQAVFRGLNDGGGRIFTDDLGNAWNPTFIEHFTPEGRIRQDAAGWLWQDYTASFLYIGS